MSDDKSDDEPKKGKKKKRAIIAVIILFGAAYQFVLKPSPATEDLAAADGEVTIEEGDVVPLPELVVNLADTDQIRYARVGVAVVLERGVDPLRIEPKLPLVSDIVIDVISEMTMAELTGEKSQLKEQLSELARAEFDDSEIARIIFTTFVMQ